MIVKRPFLVILFPIMIGLVIAWSVTNAQTDLPPLPGNMGEGAVLFPQAVQHGQIEAGGVVRYIFVAFQNEDISITMTREDGELVPYMELKSLDGTLLEAKAAGDLAGRQARLNFTANIDGWYYLDVSHDPATGETKSGTYRLFLLGATSNIYRLLAFGDIPILRPDDLVLLHERTLEIGSDATTRYFVPARSEEVLTIIPSDGWVVSLFDDSGTMLVQDARTLNYLNERKQWLRVEVATAGDAGGLNGAINGTPVATFGGPLSSFITLTPTVTSTSSATPSVTPSPTATLVPTATPRPLDLSQTHIVFTCFVGGFDQLCLMNADGSNTQQLTSSYGTSWYATITQTGAQIVYSSIRSGGFEIYLMNIDGSGDTRLTDGADGYAPMVSPDGSRIVFAAKQQNSDQDIYTINIDGTGMTRLTSAGGEDQDPIWSPDGRQILFSSNRGGQRNLWTMNADGSNPVQITSTGVRGRCDWSPDGSHIAYYAGPDGREEVYIMNIDGSDLRQLTSGGSNKAPSFSPDGQWIAYASKIDGDNEIFIMRIDGTQKQQLTFNSRPDYQPRWGR